MDRKIAIIGYGFVGRAVGEWFKEKQPLIYDKYSPGYQKDNINEADIIFVCVPTPFNDGFDDKEVIDSLKKINKGKIVVIKSTIIPGSTEKYQKKFPHLKILFNPEFLVEKTSEYDFIHPERQIIGFTGKSKECAEEILSLLPKAPWKLICDSKVAEMAKYVNNAFLATKLIFFEQIFDICVKSKIPYESVKWIVTRDPRISESHTTIGMDDKRGFAGKCLPKDLSSLIEFAEELKSEPLLLKAVDYLNEQYNG